jgi:hypothetical protein
MMKKRRRVLGKDTPREMETRLRSMGLQPAAGWDDSFLRHIAALESVPTMTIREQIAARGRQVPAALWQLIELLAEMNIVIERTDHLDDAALYAFLTGYLDEYVHVPEDPTTIVHVDLLGGGSPEECELNLRYYADDEEREMWQSLFPNEEQPPREKPPADRDRLLPTAEDVRAGVLRRRTA